MAVNTSHQREIGRRLAQLRAALGVSQAELCRRLEITTTAWNNWEKGKRRINVDDATKIRKATGATLDWIYHGDRTSLPWRIAKMLPPEETPQDEQAAS